MKDLPMDSHFIIKIFLLDYLELSVLQNERYCQSYGNNSICITFAKLLRQIKIIDASVVAKFIERILPYLMGKGGILFFKHEATRPLYQVKPFEFT